MDFSSYYDYFLQGCLVILGTLAGWVLGLRSLYGYMVGSILLILTVLLSVYLLKKFDARPDITKARQEITEYAAKLESLNSEYNLMKTEANQATKSIQVIRENLNSLYQDLIKVGSKLHQTNMKADINLLATGIKELDKLFRK